MSNSRVFTLQVRLTEREYEALRKAAEKTGRTASEVTRNGIRRELEAVAGLSKRGVEIVVTPIPYVRAESAE